jgi:hypothetical protein
MSTPFADKTPIEVDTVVVVDKYGVDEEYNTKTHPGMKAELVDVGGQVELVVRIPIPPGSNPQTRQAPRG